MLGRPLQVGGIGVRLETDRGNDVSSRLKECGVRMGRNEWAGWGRGGPWATEKRGLDITLATDGLRKG